MGVSHRARRGWSPAAIAITLALGGSASAVAGPASDDAPAREVAQLSGAAPTSAAVDQVADAPLAAVRVGAASSIGRLDARAAAALLAGYRAQVAAAPLTCNLEVSLLAAVVAARPSAVGGSGTASVARQLCAGARDLSDPEDLRAGLWAVEPSPSFAGLVATYQSRYVRLGLDRDLAVTELQSQDLVGGSLTATSLLPVAPASAPSGSNLGAAAERAAERAFRQGARKEARPSAKPSTSGAASGRPTARPSQTPTPTPSPTVPAESPTGGPSGKPTGTPSGSPSGTPTGPSATPSPTGPAPSPPGDEVECAPPTKAPAEAAAGEGDPAATCPPCVPAGAKGSVPGQDPSGTGATAGTAASREAGEMCVPADDGATAPSPSSGQ